MDYRNIKNITKRQFDETIRKEGFTLIDFYSNAPYKVFFRKMDHSDSTVSKVRIYYSQDTPIERGSLLIFKGETYLAINKDAIESEVYYTAVCCRCNTSLAVDGKVIPFVLNTPNLSVSGTFIRSIASNLTLFTGDSAVARKMKINDEYLLGGRTWSVLNTLYIDGLYYVLLQMTTETNERSIEWTGAYQYDIADTTYVENHFHAMRGSAEDTEAVLTYTSSDTDIVSIDSNGVLTLIKNGTVSITATWEAEKITKTVELSVFDSAGAPEAQYTCKITHSGISNELKTGGSYKKFTARFYDEDGNESDFQSGGTWSFLLRKDHEEYSTNGVDAMDVIYSSDALNENQIQIKLSSAFDLWIGGAMLVTYTAPSGVSGSDELRIVGL